MSADRQSKLYLDPHLHFVMGGKYVVCTAKNADGTWLDVTAVKRMIEMTSTPGLRHL